MVAIMWSASVAYNFQTDSFFAYDESPDLATEEDAGDIVRITKLVATQLSNGLPILNTLKEIIDYVKANF